MTDNTNLNELTPGEHETEAVAYSMRSSSPNWGEDYGDYNEPENNFPDSGSTSDDIEVDNGGYTPPATTEPDIESTEGDGVYPNPSNPGTNVGSSTSDGVHTDPDRPSPGSGSSSCPPTDNDGGEHSHPPSTDPEIGSTTKDDGVHTGPDRPSTGSGSSSCPPTDDNGGEHSHPSTTDPDIGSTTEDDGVQKDPTNPGTEVDSSTSDGVHTDPDKPASGSSSGSYPPTGGNEGGYTPPTTTDPDINSTEDDGVQKDPTNPGTDVDSSTSDGVHTDPENPGGDADSSSSSTTVGTTTKPIHPSVKLIAPSASRTEQLKDNHKIVIEAEGENCSNINVFVNGTCMHTVGGNYLAYSYPVDMAGKYTICAVGTSRTGHTASSASRTITIVEKTYTVTYDLNGGMGITPEKQTIPIGENVTLASLEHPRDCYKLDHIFEGWNTAADGSGALYFQGKTTSFDSNITLYAQFTYAADN